MEKETEQKSEAVCPSKLELAEVRDKLARTKSGPQYWRSLEELAQTEGFFEMVHREFPRQASVWPEGASRRDFMKLMTASMALAGLSACVKQPLEPIVPYVRQPEPIVLGLPLYFASAMPFGGYAAPVLVESHEGRPTKVEGNPDHPAGVGSDVFAQASILDMYDPDRSQSVTVHGIHPDVERFRDGHAGASEFAEGRAGRRNARADPDGEFADVGGADERVAGAVSEGEVGAV